MPSAVQHLGFASVYQLTPLAPGLVQEPSGTGGEVVYIYQGCHGRLVDVIPQLKYSFSGG
jgi:hypothetical protein